MTKNLDNYDFDLILSSDDFKRNQQKYMNQNTKRNNTKKLKKWVKNLLWLILGAIIGIIIYQLIAFETVKETPVGNYTCRGGVIQICSSSKEVADYLGVE